MFNIIRTYITTCIVVMRGDESQIDQNGRDKIVAALWADLPRLHEEIRSTVWQLLQDGGLSELDPHAEESTWLSAVYDEMQAGSPGQESSLDESDSWFEVLRHIALLAFCLRQASHYAPDQEYGREGFERIKSGLAELGQDEAVFAELALNRLIGQVEASSIPQKSFILETYAQLHASLTQLSS